MLSEFPAKVFQSSVVGEMMLTEDHSFGIDAILVKEFRCYVFDTHG